MKCSAVSATCDTIRRNLQPLQATLYGLQHGLAVYEFMREKSEESLRKRKEDEEQEQSQEISSLFSYNRHIQNQNCHEKAD